MEKKLYELPSIVVFDLDKNSDIITTSTGLNAGGAAGFDDGEIEGFPG